ncbi:hypothetical protein B5F55_08330 [Anaerotruncus colihominis]|uniref:sporulation protein YqfD n=1 Tax=Anaerotruncus colihominis TaxID=169435 RepID=UPI000B387FF1|nr:sporulation protein YqfD [Anaerotruncus colihominis]OUO67487.1 hypothetical protein B5F55_08330 [Anaerotruncus colihominis]
MLFVRLLRWLRGYVCFSARSGSVERLMSLCAHHHIVLWGCRRMENGFTGFTTARGYRRLHPYARKAGVTARVGRRYGLPFLLYRYRRRTGIAAGVLICILFLIISQQFVWVVRIEGNERIDSQVLYQALEEMGVRRGTRKGAIDEREIARALPVAVDGLAWAALNIQGTTATLLVHERTDPPPKIDTNVPANVVAAADGQIVRMEVTDGRAAAKIGDAVHTGDIIVSGIIEDRWGMTHLLRANARVFARVPQTLEARVPLVLEEPVPTGRIVKRRYLELAGVRLPLFIYSGLEGDYKLERVTSQPKAGPIDLPFCVTRETYIFYELQKEQLGQQAALRLAQRQLEALERETWDQDAVKKRDVSASVENGELVLRGDYIVEMDIARQVEIPVTQYSQEKDEKKPARAGGY